MGFLNPYPPHIIRPYQPSDENGWLRCRVLAFLDTAYFDDVCQEKEQYNSRAIELVAEADGTIVGLIDVECEKNPGAICSTREGTEARGPTGMIWHLAVHPDYRRQGIGSALLAKAREHAQAWRIERFEAWTRDDQFVEQWYCSQGFRWMESYYHVYIEHRKEMEKVIECNVSGLRPLCVFAHYAGDDASFLRKFKRVHRCNRYELCLGKQVP